MLHRAKFRADRLNSCRDIANWPYFDIMSIAAVRHLRNYNCQYGSEGQFASLGQISRRSVKPLLSLATFRFFKLRPFAMLNLLYVCLDHIRRGFVTLQSSV